MVPNNPTFLVKVLENVSDAVYMFDKKWRFTYLNAAAERYWGRCRHELLGKVTWEEFPSTTETIFHEEYHRAVRERTDVHLEGFAPVQGKWVEVQAWVIDEGLIVCVRDISEQTNYKMKLETLLELCPLAIRMADHEGNHVFSNKAYMDMFCPNHTKADLVGKSLASFSEIIGIAPESTVTYATLQGEEFRNAIRRIKDKTLLVNSVQAKIEGVLAGAMVLFHDITEYDRLRQEMNNLDRLNLIGQMAAGVAHEIRNPLTAVKGYLQFLQKKVPEDIIEQFQIVLMELGHVEALITDFLSLARNKATEKRIANLNTITTEVVSLIQPEAIKRDLLLLINLSEEVTDQLLDAKQIRQVILNLSQNAFDAMDKHGVLRIQTMATDGTNTLLISDTGHGIPKEKLRRIFEPFYTTRETGTGLGLAICENMIKEHGGSIEVSSDPGKGTCFKITFPQNTPL